MQNLHSTAYFPNVLWLSHAIQGNGIVLEAHEHFQKQSYRSRTQIAGPQGIQSLNIPVNRSVKNILETPISYREDWVKVHLKAIESAYANSAFFESLMPDITSLLCQKHEDLWSLNFGTIGLYLKWLDITLPIDLTERFEVSTSYKDLRHLHPKKQVQVHFPMYHQVFIQKNGFLSNMSALDVFFNLGRASWDYFQELNLSFE